MFVQPESLPFDLTELPERTLVEWHSDKPASVPLPDMESAGDFIVSEMNTAGLRRFDGPVADFNVGATSDEYRNCTITALDRWLAEV